MKMRNLCQCLVFFVFLFSCSDENLPSSSPSSDEFLYKTQETSNRIDIKEVTSLIDGVVAFLDEKDPSKAGSSRIVDSVSVLRFNNIKSSALKSGKYDDIEISDTLAYVFNFKDSMGFVIVSNDKRVDSPLLAFTKKGSLINGKTDNPGLSLFLKRLEGYTLESIVKSSKTDGQKLEETQKGFPTSITFPSITGEGPLVSVEWGQQKPFNNNLGGSCSNTNNGKYLAGCVATATAQIMSYWEYPKSLDGHSYDWTRLKNYKHSDDFYPSSINIVQGVLAKLDVANLFQKIGTGVSMKYDCGVSLAATADALNLLVSYGFTSHFTPVLVSYNIGRVKTVLTSKRPVIARGCDYSIYGYERCHAWVIDGFLDITTQTYIHNNWGWDGDANGYYNNGIFDPITMNDAFYFQGVEIGAVYK